MTETKQMPQQAQNSTQAKPNFRPLGNRVLVRRIDEKETLKGGIILPDTAKKKQEQAEVIAIGTGKKDKSGNLIPIPVQVGQVVLMEKYSGQEIKLNEQDFVIVKADDLIAIVEK